MSKASVTHGMGDFEFGFEFEDYSAVAARPGPGGSLPNCANRNFGIKAAPKQEEGAAMAIKSLKMAEARGPAMHDFVILP